MLFFGKRKRPSDAAPKPSYSRAVIEQAVEHALALKGTAWAAFQLGCDLRQAQIEQEIEEPRVHGIAMSEFMRRAALGSDTEELAERLADLVFIGHLTERFAAGDIPPPAEAVEIYLSGAGGAS